MNSLLQLLAIADAELQVESTGMKSLTHMHGKQDLVPCTQGTHQFAQSLPSRVQPIQIDTDSASSQACNLD